MLTHLCLGSKDRGWISVNFSWTSVGGRERQEQVGQKTSSNRPQGQLKSHIIGKNGSSSSRIAKAAVVWRATHLEPNLWEAEEPRGRWPVASVWMDWRVRKWRPAPSFTECLANGLLPWAMCPGRRPSRPSLSFCRRKEGAAGRGELASSWSPALCRALGYPWELEGKKLVSPSWLWGDPIFWQTCFYIGQPIKWLA